MYPESSGSLGLKLLIFKFYFKIYFNFNLNLIKLFLSYQLLLQATLGFIAGSTGFFTSAKELPYGMVWLPYGIFNF